MVLAGTVRAWEPRGAIDDVDPRLSKIEALILGGRMLTALQEAESIAPLASWRGPRAVCTAAWLLDHLGDSSTARRSYARAARAHPAHARVRYFYTTLLARERGPLEAWLSLQAHRPEGGTPEQLAELTALEAQLLAHLGDHSAADAALARCDRQALGETTWSWAQSTLFERRGERQRALDVLEAALLNEPPQRLLVQQAAALLEALNRRQDALTLLQRTEPLLEAPGLTSQRASLEHELELFDRERVTLDRFESLLTRADTRARRVLAARRAENAYRRGDVAETIRQAESTKIEHWEKLVPRLRSNPTPPRRKRLDVPVSIQEPMGCAPTSLAIISRYFGYPVDQIEVADQICYEGTASHSERGWAEARGWISREFTVDFDTAATLIERDVPFLLVTVDIASAHAQVVIGVDATRRTLIIRDPMSYRTSEYDADTLFESHRAYGPRGHVILPPERAAALNGVTLPESELHDLAHALRLALETHDSARIDAALANLRALAATHPLTLWAARGVAAANEDPYAVRECSEALLARFPDAVNAELSVLDCLAQTGTEAEQRARIEARLEEPKAPWIFRERHARLLASDAADHDRALRLAWRAHRAVPLRGHTIALLAEIERARGKRERSLMMLRAAATLEPTDDELAWAYFQEAFQVGAAKDALALLTERGERFAQRSGHPISLVFRALEWLDRVSDAFQALEKGISRRPSDGALALFAAEAHARYRRPERARELLERARGRVSTAAFEQSAAAVAELQGDLNEALVRHRGVLKEQPLSLRSHQAVAGLLHELSGAARAREHLAAACKAYPTHCGLRELYVGWLRGHDPAHVVPEIDDLLALQPAHAWARRERALVLSELGDHERALMEAETCCRRAPNHPSSHAVLSAVLLAGGRREEALASARRVLELYADVPGGVTTCLRLARSYREQLELFDWVERKLRDRSVSGAGLREWHGYASGLLSDQVLLEKAQRILAERPGLWVGHHLVSLQLLRTGQVGPAREFLERATEQFPFNVDLWLDLADACRAAGDRVSEVNAAANAVRLDPSYVPSVLRLSDAELERQNSLEAKRVLQRGLEYRPRAAALLQALAKLFWKEGATDAAFDHIRAAIGVQPEAADPWDLYYGYAHARQRSREVVEFARKLLHERPWNADLWLRLAEILRLESENLESLEAIAQALERSPRSADAIHTYVMTLTRVGRKEEALAACERPVDSYFARGSLRARRAWVKWEFGEPDAACLEMRQVIADHPDQVFALRTLLEWETQREQHEAAVRIARELVKVAPLDAQSFGFLGHAELAAKHVDSAWDALSQAAEMDPSYAFAGNTRIQIALERRRLPDAESVLATQGPHVPAPMRDAWEVAIAAKAEDAERAERALARMAKHSVLPIGAVSLAAEEFSRFSVAQFRQVLRRVMRDPNANAEVGALWVRTYADDRREASPFVIARLAKRNPEAARIATRAFFEQLGDKRSSTLRILFPLLVLGKLVREDDVAWGKVGYALLVKRAYVLGQLWLSSYRSRRGVEPWMLANYRHAALENHQPQRALAASEYALTFPADETLGSHLAFVAFGRAANGDLDGAEALLEGLELGAPPGRVDWYLASARSLVRLDRAAPEERATVLMELRADAGGTILSGMGLFSTGQLHRWLAAGVLRQRFDANFFFRRWALWLAVAFFAMRLSMHPSFQASGALTVAVVLLILYGTARLFI